MKEQDVWQRMESFVKMPRAAAIIVAALVELACSKSRVEGNAGDAALVEDGPAATSQGGTGGSCVYLEYPPCNPNDQRVTSGPESDYSGDCPPERECYSLPGFDGFGHKCGSALCVVPEGVHCNDPLSCNPGDTPAISTDEDCAFASLCYRKVLCAQSLLCIVATSACAALQSGTWTDGGVLEYPDASADGNHAGRAPCCGDGIVDPQSGEMCDLGPLNGVAVDVNGNPTDGGYGVVLCDFRCQIPFCPP